MNLKNLTRMKDSHNFEELLKFEVVKEGDLKYDLSLQKVGEIDDPENYFKYLDLAKKVALKTKMPLGKYENYFSVYDEEEDVVVLLSVDGDVYTDKPNNLKFFFEDPNNPVDYEVVRDKMEELFEF